MAVQKWAAQKWVFLLSNSEKGAEDLKSVLKKLNLERDSEDCLHCYSGSCFSPVDSKVPRFPVQDEPSPGLKLRSFELSDLREMEVDSDCVWYHVISCPQQTPIHLSILINGNGVYIIVCHQADSSEDKLMYVKRSLDLIIDSTSENYGSCAFIDGLDLKDFAHIEKYNSSTRKVRIFTLKKVEWDSIAKTVSSHRSEALVLSEKVFPILKDKDDRTRKPLVAYQPNGEWKDELKVCKESLESLHRLGWIYLQDQADLDWNLVFTSPKLFHDILKKIYEFRSSGKDVPNMITTVYWSMQLIYRSIEIKKFAIPFEKLLLNLNLAVTVTVCDNMTVELVSRYSEVNIDEIPTSSAPLLVKFKTYKMTSQESFVRFAILLEDQTNDVFLKISEVALNCITFQGHGFNLYMCRRASTILEFRVEESWHKDYRPDKVSTSDYFSVLKAIRNCASDSKYQFTLGFTCDLAKDNVDHAKICVYKFAKYENDGEIKLYCVAKGCCRQPYMQDQNVWFGESLQVPCSFDLLPHTQGRIIVKVHHTELQRPPAAVQPAPKKGGQIKSIGDLLPFVNSMLPHLGRLGPALGIPEYAIAIIGGPKSNPDKCQDILQYWLNCTPAATWDLLCEKLISTKVPDLATLVAKIQEAQQ